MHIPIDQHEALQYHAQQPSGKLAMQPTKPLRSQRDLALAYTPGVSFPCQAIAADKSQVFTYTAKGNLVAVISNGTAVLGLGDIGPEAAKPVMEGKAVLFKQLAGLDAFDLEIAATEPADCIAIIKALAPTFGGINLEDIKAPACFEIEEALVAALNIPVMHDDQHGTAVVASAALLNACSLVGKPITTLQVVISGAGAGAIASANLYKALGVRAENIILCDSQGVIRQDRPQLPPSKAPWATHRPVYTLSAALQGADVLVGLSAAHLVQAADLQAMAPDPIVFALANPTPEIGYEEAQAARPDAIVATGASNYPNQVNNALCFPYIFRGALDVRATKINQAMKLAAVHALADLAKQAVPAEVYEVYDSCPRVFGKTYLLPKPLDPRLLTTVAKAVAQAAMQSGVAQQPITDWTAYHHALQQRRDTLYKEKAGD